MEAKHGSVVEFDSPKPIEGYYQTLGVTARNQAELVQLVKEYIFRDLESTLLDVAEMWLPDFENEDADIKDVCGDLTKIGVWYHSGRAWFHENDDDEDEDGDDSDHGEQEPGE